MGGYQTIRLSVATDFLYERTHITILQMECDYVLDRNCYPLDEDPPEINLFLADLLQISPVDENYQPRQIGYLSRMPHYASKMWFVIAPTRASIQCRLNITVIQSGILYESVRHIITRDWYHVHDKLFTLYCIHSESCITPNGPNSRGYANIFVDDAGIESYPGWRIMPAGLVYMTGWVLI